MLSAFLSPTLPPFPRQPHNKSPLSPPSPQMTTPTSPKTQSPPSTKTPPPHRSVLFVCLGNICRSPAAASIFQHHLSTLPQTKHNPSYKVDSCGTGGGYETWLEDSYGHHQGDPPDARMRKAATKRGISVEGASRILEKDDFERFRYIVGMDHSNLAAVRRAKRFWKIQGFGGELRLMSEFGKERKFRGRAVPDPYYGGTQGFNHALDLLQDCCVGLYEYIEQKYEESKEKQVLEKQSEK